MQTKTFASGQKSLWKRFKTPTMEVVAAIMIVLGATWFLVQAESEEPRSLFPVPFVHR